MTTLISFNATQLLNCLCYKNSRTWNKAGVYNTGQWDGKSRPEQNHRGFIRPEKKVEEKKNGE